MATANVDAEKLARRPPQAKGIRNPARDAPKRAQIRAPSRTVRAGGQENDGAPRPGAEQVAEQVAAPVSAQADSVKL